MPEFFNVCRPRCCATDPARSLAEARGNRNCPNTPGPGPRHCCSGARQSICQRFRAQRWMGTPSVPATPSALPRVCRRISKWSARSGWDRLRPHPHRPGRGRSTRVVMLAHGADAVVMVENTQAIDATSIEVLRPVAPGENVVQVGEDVRRGEVILPAGCLEIRPQDIGGMVALGITQIMVRCRPRVAIVSTGDEIVAPDPRQRRADP